MINIFSSGFLSRYSIDKSIIEFSRRYDKKNKIIVDVGCGEKPYEKYFKKSEYIGVDIFKSDKVDIVAQAWKIPLKENYADIILLNQSLEHIERIEDTVKEISRILKPGGVVLISVPLIMKVHPSPIDSKKTTYQNFDKKQIPFWNVDFWRFTKFGLISLFRDYKIMQIKESNGYFTTIFQMINYFFKSIDIPFIFIPIYLINNLLALLSEIIFRLIGKIKINNVKKFMTLIYYSAPLNYIMIAKNVKRT